MLMGKNKTKQNSSYSKGSKSQFILSQMWVNMAWERGFTLPQMVCSTVETVTQIFNSHTEQKEVMSVESTGTMVGTAHQAGWF